MSKLTIKAVAEKSGVSATLTRAVSRQFGGWADLKESAVDIAAHGAHSEYCGHSFPVAADKFALNNKLAIVSALRDIALRDGHASAARVVAGFRDIEYSEEQVSAVLSRAFVAPDSDYVVFNALAWFALEHVAHAVAAEED